MATSHVWLAKFVKQLFELANIKGTIYVKDSLYEFTVEEEFEVDKMLALFAHTGDEITLRIHQDNFVCSHCFAAFTAMAYLCAGTMTDPNKEYCLEFVHTKYSMMQDFFDMLQQNNFSPKLTNRKGSNVLYFKLSEQIEDLLTYMGAGQAALEIMSLKVYKDYRNTANRITNCETANIEKMVAANYEVLNAIDTLKQYDMLDTLSDSLKEAAELRELYPDLSLLELSKKFKAPISKSGLNYRLKRICALADKCLQNKGSIQNGAK